MSYTRNIFCLFLMLAVFSCKKLPEDTPITNTESSTIEFDPWIRTKAYITSAEDPAFQAGISVFATKNPIGTDRSKVIMDNVKLHDTDHDGVWTYQLDENGTQAYWGLNCNHYFLGIYPYKNKSDQNGQYTDQDNMITLPSVSTITQLNTKNEGKNLGDDLMYGHENISYQLGDIVQKVQLEMHHALSAISINIRNASETSSNPQDNDIVQISNIKLSNFITDITDFKISKIEEIAPTWTEDKTRRTYIFEDYNQTIPQGDIHPKPIFSNPAIIIPQDFTLNPENQHLKLSFDVMFHDGTIKPDVIVDLNVIELPNKNAKDKLKYLPGYHYKYNIEITSVNINCRVQIVPWKEDEAIDLK